MTISEEQLLKYKSIILDIAKYFDSFCSKHNLRYYAIGGTAIGALRHGGIIPWDDDIDFVMPRPDYEKFIQLSKTEMPSKYDLFIPGETKDYHLTMTKMCNAKTSLLGSPRHKCVIGAFIDIFPMDGMPQTDEKGRRSYFYEYYKKRRLAEVINTYYSFADFCKSLLRGRWKNIKHIIISKYYHLLNKKNNMFYECNKILLTNDFDSCDYVAYFATNNGAKVISPRNWFEIYKYVSFEDFQLRLPNGIHEYLTQVYGDYMTPPSLENRASRHSFHYLNLDKRVSYKDAIKELKAK